MVVRQHDLITIQRSHAGLSKGGPTGPERSAPRSGALDSNRAAQLPMPADPLNVSTFER